MSPFHRRAMRIAAFLGLISTAAGITGCGGSNSGAKAELPPPQVTVAAPVALPITRYEYATGRTEPLEQVEVRARVSGYLDAIKFEPGKEVKKDQVLFEIDPDPFKADHAKAKANEEIAVAEKSTAEADLVRADARLVFTKGEFARQDEQFKKGGGSQKELDKAKSDFDESSATVKSTNAKIKLASGKINEAKSEVEKAKLNLDFCTIRAPIDGLVGDRLVTVGNLVTGGVGNTTLLTTIVAVEKMDVGFDVDEGTIQRLRKAIKDKQLAISDDRIPADGGLAIDGTDYPLHGTIEFFDNKLDPKTGTQRLKARFDNPMIAAKQRMLSAGMYARIRVPVGKPSTRMLVPEDSLGSEQGERFLYLLDGENKAIKATVQSGIAVDASDPSGRIIKMRVIESVAPAGGGPRALTEKDRVVVSGVMRVRPGLIVDPADAPKVELGVK